MQRNNRTNNGYFCEVSVEFERNFRLDIVFIEPERMSTREQIENLEKTEKIVNDAILLRRR